MHKLQPSFEFDCGQVRWRTCELLENARRERRGREGGGGREPQGGREIEG